MVAGKAIEQQVGLPGFARKFPKAAVHRRDLTATVERLGLMRFGDVVTAEVLRKLLTPLRIEKIIAIFVHGSHG